MLIANSTNERIFTSKNDNSCGGRASELVSDKFICTYLGKANHNYIFNIEEINFTWKTAITSDVSFSKSKL